MPTSQLTRQLRLQLTTDAHAQLIQLQSDAVRAGYRKPSFSDVIDALIRLSETVDLPVLMTTVEATSQ